MFHASPGFQAQYHDLTLIVALEFDHWKILLHSPAVIIDGGRQSDPNLAKEQAREVAESYFREAQADQPCARIELAWTRLGAQSCLTWAGTATKRATAAPL